jgi:hypothetical protein
LSFNFSFRVPAAHGAPSENALRRRKIPTRFSQVKSNLSVLDLDSHRIQFGPANKTDTNLKRERGNDWPSLALRVGVELAETKRHQPDAPAREKRHPSLARFEVALLGGFGMSRPSFTR